MLKRIGLLILTNIAIVVMLNVILSIVGVVFGINWGGMEEPENESVCPAGVPSRLRGDDRPYSGFSRRD